MAGYHFGSLKTVGVDAEIFAELVRARLPDVARRFDDAGMPLEVTVSRRQQMKADDYI